mmetsp:Transcript_13685/g.34410  ORF Transcript_13685/g.34410 Transcript_13685/m.34410 type:complete len:267 (-) Transcript_13685:802-1602(-)
MWPCSEASHRCAAQRQRRHRSSVARAGAGGPALEDEAGALAEVVLEQRALHLEGVEHGAEVVFRLRCMLLPKLATIDVVLRGLFPTLRLTASKADRSIVWLASLPQGGACDEGRPGHFLPSAADCSVLARVVGPTGPGALEDSGRERIGHGIDGRSPLEKGSLARRCLQAGVGGGGGDRRAGAICGGCGGGLEGRPQILSRRLPTWRRRPPAHGAPRTARLSSPVRSRRPPRLALKNAVRDACLPVRVLQLCRIFKEMWANACEDS